MTITQSSRLSEAEVRHFLSDVERRFDKDPFSPHPLINGGHAQTLAAYAWPRRFRLRAPDDETRLFQVAPDTQVLAHCRWQTNRREHPTVVIWHGIEGSSDGVYMLATARKAFSAGFNVLRMNLRNCGGTEHLTPSIYHGGLSEDLKAVVTELIERDESQVKDLCLRAGFQETHIGMERERTNCAIICRLSSPRIRAESKN